MKTILLPLAAAAGIGAGGAALAHHSFAMFDTQGPKKRLEGVVYEFQWTNPHAFIEIDVTGEDGTTQRWAVELNSPNNLSRQGWTRRTVEHGDQVVIEVSPLRDGQPGGLFYTLTKTGPDGETIEVLDPTAVAARARAAAAAEAGGGAAAD